MRNGKYLTSSAHGSDLPAPQPLPDAVAAGVFGVFDDGHMWPSEEHVRSITEEQANEMIILLADVTYLERCQSRGIDPATRKRPRAEARREQIALQIQREIQQLAERYEGCFGAYADGFGFDAADALDQYVRRRVAEHVASDGSVEVQREMF